VEFTTRNKAEKHSKAGRRSLKEHLKEPDCGAICSDDIPSTPLSE
jgi:hypothetical protein